MKAKLVLPLLGVLDGGTGNALVGLVFFALAFVAAYFAKREEQLSEDDQAARDGRPIPVHETTPSGFAVKVGIIAAITSLVAAALFPN
jgi:hypothetical protein